jgi:excinuclease UvrABC nuclease subunit
LLYVGCSEHLRNRVKTHWRSQTWRNEIDSVKFTKYKTRSEALAAEAVNIQTLHPRYNVAGVDLP